MRWILNCSGLVVSGFWLATAGIVIPASGWAQQVDEITVTARLREESLQEVPISIVAFGEKQLRERNIDGPYDIASFTPNFNMARNLGRRLDRPIIRGMFPPGRGRANASFFVDGVFLPGEHGSIAVSSLDNIQRVEVLRGPQSALFGRATFAGAVNYITRDIRDVWEGEVNARAGSDSDYKLSVWGSGPIIEDKLKVYVGAGVEGWDGEWRNDLREGQANASNDQSSSLNFFSGPGVWQYNIPDFAAGQPACPDGYNFARVNINPGASGSDRVFLTNPDAGCPPQRADNTRLGGEDLWNAVIKFEFTPTDNWEFGFKYEVAETDDDPFAQMLFEDSSFGPVNGIQLAPGLNCSPPFYDAALSQMVSGDDPRTEDIVETSHLLEGTYIPSPGAFCGELNFDLARSQSNFPSFDGVATCPPGQICNQFLEDENGDRILDENGFYQPLFDARGNFLPAIASAPAPFIGAQTKTERFLAEALYTVNDWEFLARGTLGYYDNDNVRDLERSYALGPVTTGLFEGFSVDRAETESVEFKVSSPTDARIRGMLGYYYYYQQRLGDQRRFNSFSNGFMFGFSGDEEEKNHAVFGSIEYDVTDQFSLTFDGRYAEDTLTQTASPEICALGEFCAVEETFYSFSPRFIIDYHPNDDLNFYFSLAKGNKPGGFNGEWFDDNTTTEITEAALGLNCDPADAPDLNTAGWINSVCGKAIVEEEESWNWEIGAKTVLMDGRLIANAALFYIDWTNQGINNNQCVPRADIRGNDNPDYDPGMLEGPDNEPFLPNFGCEDNLGVINAGETRIYGTEVELQFAATDNLDLALSYGLTDSKLEDYFDDGLASATCNQWAFADSPKPLVQRPLADCKAQGAGNAAGHRSELVPKHSANLSATYTRSMSGEKEWFVRSFLNYESKKYVTVANRAWLGDIYIWNASAGLRGDRWQVTAYVDNILDEDTPVIAFDFPLFDNSKIPNLPGYGFNNDKVNGQAGLLNSQIFLLTPRRGTNYGVRAQYSFGG